MVVRLRLSRQGTRNNPFYHVVAINDSKPRDARPIEKLGEFDPIPRPPRSAARLPTPFAGSKAPAPGQGALMKSGLANESEKVTLQKRLEWNEDRIKHWLSLGAQPSKPVARLLDRVSIQPPTHPPHCKWARAPSSHFTLVTEGEREAEETEGEEEDKRGRGRVC